MASLEIAEGRREGQGSGERSCWEWFNHGAGGDQGKARHPEDIRDYGFVPARSLLGVVPFTLGFLVFMQWYPAADGFDPSLWTDPTIVVSLTLVPVAYMFLTPLFGMRGPDPGWNADPPKINYSLSHLIDSRLQTALMSVAWIYPCTLLWATECRADWLPAHSDDPPPGGLLTYLFLRGGLFQGGGVQVLRRIALLVWQLGFTGFLAITDSTLYSLHLTMVFVFAGGMMVYLFGALVGAGAVAFQLLAIVSALAGLIAFIVFNQPFDFSRRGVGYWYWFVEVWALASVLAFMPARLLLDEDASAGAAAVVAALAATGSSSGLLEWLKRV